MTTIPTVKALLVGAWATALPDVQVVYGPLSAASVVKPKALSVGNVEGRVDVSDLGRQSSTETYTVNCLISVALATSNQQAADEACLSIFTGAVTAVRGLELDNVSITVSGDFEFTETASDQGRAAELTFPVAVFATF